MKLLLCISCFDVQRLQPGPRTCKCGQAHGNLSGSVAVVNENALVIGIGDNDLQSALVEKANRPADTQPINMFLLPEPCNAVRRVKGHGAT